MGGSLEAKEVGRLGPQASANVSIGSLDKYLLENINNSWTLELCNQS
jgi:hypothetical protein